MTKEVFVLATKWPHEGCDEPLAAFFSYSKALIAQHKQQDIFDNSFDKHSEYHPKVILFILEVEDDK